MYLYATETFAKKLITFQFSLLLSQKAMVSKKVVITGISGTIPKYFIKNFIDSGWKVTGQTRKPMDDFPGIDIKVCELTDLESVCDLFDEADVVIHSAALTRSSRPDRLRESNEKVTATVLKAVTMATVNRLIFLSTDLANEPLGPYGKSKLACEELILRSGISDWCILRLAPVLTDVNDNGNSTYSRLIRLARRRKMLLLPGGGEFEVAPVYHQDLAFLIKSIAEYQGNVKRTYSVFGTKFKLSEFLQAVCESDNTSIALVSIPLKLIRILIRLAPFNLSVFETLMALGRTDNLFDVSLVEDWGYAPSSFETLIDSYRL